MDTSDDRELSQRLDVYQAFLKLYEHRRGLLDELLDLENATNALLLEQKLFYIQGLIEGDRVQLITNLINDQTQILTQPQNIWTIGRDSRQVGIPLQDKRLSRCHAAIRYIKDKGFYLADLNSSNGSFINGDRIHEARRLQQGDQIRLGGSTIVFFTGSTHRDLPAVSADLIDRIETVPIDATSPPDAEVPSRALSHAESVLPPDRTLLISRSAKSSESG
ncbi:FHA domain-containing protein [Microcoleus sp. FACHB-1515]|uniref:FHA domain-containing protein n=1 Tax=Cyanophyceae TaxID=3028117 RepID=UPI001683E4FB|nr:FHA domain-containing protein [Microcoleus sp. FACHB-1515]MBD2090230.1 FHA domain-containing protein [Microcoleus sp. FACHB-1515]